MILGKVKDYETKDTWVESKAKAFCEISGILLDFFDGVNVDDVKFNINDMWDCVKDGSITMRDLVEGFVDVSNALFKINDKVRSLYKESEEDKDGI